MGRSDGSENKGGKWLQAGKTEIKQRDWGGWEELEDAWYVYVQQVSLSKQ